MIQGCRGYRLTAPEMDFFLGGKQVSSLAALLIRVAPQCLHTRTREEGSGTTTTKVVMMMRASHAWCAVENKESARRHFFCIFWQE